PDGRFLLFEQSDPVTGWDTWILPMQGDRTPIPYLRSTFAEFPTALSPDGKWLAYWCDESGVPRIYVQSFPHPGEKHLLSDITAGSCFWSHDGREMVIVSLDNTAWLIPVVTSPSFQSGTPKRLFRLPVDEMWFTATADLRRFLVCVPAHDVAQPS